MNSYTKCGGAARRRFCVICKKPEGGGAEINPPPGCARVKRLILGEICGRPIERAFQELSVAFFGFGVAIIVPEIMAGIPDKTIIFRKFDL